ncbi:MAG: DNA polymerase IV [Candidatus Eisenbacteria bacterium]|nr:DNA polymerase IV [Candidatus Eisenbacteria bacterium]
MVGSIAHVDMDAFFAAVEVRANPRLAGKPLLVGGGPPGRQVVTTASYPARACGIRSGMSLREAQSRCPDAIFLPVDPPRYLSAAESLIRIFKRFTPVVEPASIDEAFLDLSGLPGMIDGGIGTARKIQETVRLEERLTCSIGIGPSKLAAKMATGLNKPDGLTLLQPGDFERIFWSRPTSDLWGVGTESSAALGQIGITTIGQLAVADGESLASVFGVTGRVLVRMANGEGGGPVVPDDSGGAVRSMGHEMTFPRNLSDNTRLQRHLLLLTDKISRRLRRDGWAGFVVTIRIRHSDDATISRQKALACPTDDGRIIYRVSCRLLAANRNGRAIRRLGVSVGHLVRSGASFALFGEDRRARRLDEVSDRLRDRFGESAIMPAGVIALLKHSDGEEG